MLDCNQHLLTLTGCQKLSNFLSSIYLPIISRKYYSLLQPPEP